MSTNKILQGYQLSYIDSIKLNIIQNQNVFLFVLYERQNKQQSLHPPNKILEIFKL